MSPTLVGLVVAPLLLSGVAQPASHVYQPAFCLDRCLRGPAVPYTAEPGDIFLATDESFLIRAGHAVVGGAGVHHSGIVFAKPDGTMGLIEAGPFNELTIRTMDPYTHMSNHVKRDTVVWVRKRRVPLTPEQSARLTEFLMAQEGKPFALWRGLRFATPFTRRGKLRTPFVAKVHGPDRNRYFCSEMVVESLAWACLADPETSRPAATLPRDLFLGASGNPYLDRHLTINDGWLPPQRWLPGPAPVLQSTESSSPAPTAATGGF